LDDVAGGLFKSAEQGRWSDSPIYQLAESYILSWHVEESEGVEFAESKAATLNNGCKATVQLAHGPLRRRKTSPAPAVCVGVWQPPIYPLMYGKFAP
jgi:hypothetical protein